MIFVFESNLAGRNGKGAALEAMLFHGAKRGVGFGHEGQRRCQSKFAGCPGCVSLGA